MTVDQLKSFLRELKQNAELVLCSIKNTPGLNVKRQDTSPSYILG